MSKYPLEDREYQCPLCELPVTEVEIDYRKMPLWRGYTSYTQSVNNKLGPCGHVVTVRETIQMFLRAIKERRQQ